MKRKSAQKKTSSHSVSKHPHAILSPGSIMTLVAVVLVMFFLIAGTWMRRGSEDVPGMFVVSAPTPTPDYSKTPKGFSGVRFEPKGSGTKLTITTWNNSTSPVTPTIVISPAPESKYPYSVPIPTRAAGQTATVATVPHIVNGTWKWTGVGGSGDVVLGWGTDADGKCYIAGTIDPDMIIIDKATKSRMVFNIPLPKFFWPVAWTGSANITIEAHDPKARVNGVLGTGPLMGLIEVSNVKCSGMSTLTIVPPTSTKTPTKTPTKMPTTTPTKTPTKMPTTTPTKTPTKSPPSPTPTPYVDCVSATGPASIHTSGNNTVFVTAHVYNTNSALLLINMCLKSSPSTCPVINWTYAYAPTDPTATLSNVTLIPGETYDIRISNNAGIASGKTCSLITSMTPVDIGTPEPTAPVK